MHIPKFPNEKSNLRHHLNKICKKKKIKNLLTKRQKKQQK